MSARCSGHGCRTARKADNFREGTRGDVGQRREIALLLAHGTMTPQFTPVVGKEIFDLRPDYSAISVVADGVDNVAHHPAVDRYVEESLTRPALPFWAEDHVEAWRSSYRAFGAKPQRTPCSVDALLMTLGRDGRLPTINAVVDLYNAISIRDDAVDIAGRE
jgi:hypothetical protein